MRNSTTTPILLNDSSILNIYAFANAFKPKKAEKLPSPCQFMKANKLKHYIFKKSKDGNIILTAVTADGKNIHSKERNFVMAYIKLVRNFNISKL